MLPSRQVEPDIAGRLPPGQVVAKRWPVLHHGPVPEFDPETWDLRVTGLVGAPFRLTWAEFRLLPQMTIESDLHCVTRWSLLANHWRGVPFRTLLARAGVLPEARFVVLRGEGNYTANLPLSAVQDPSAMLAVANHGDVLSPEHGFPVRAVVPGRYAWKSVKWVRAIELVAEDRPGFWEEYGYHDNADPWREERFRDEPPRTGD